MNTLESPLEALALNYLRYSFLTAINNIWAWVAVVTAAVGFWRIRALSSPLLSRARIEHRRRTQDEASTTSSTPPPAEVRPATISNSAETELLATPTTGGVWETEWECDTKTKFTLYYKEDDFRDGDDGDASEGDGGGGGVVASDKLGDLCPDWERMMAVRMGDMGWYRWQDRTVLDGSVVRLWDGQRRRRAAALVVDCGGGW